MASFTGIWLVLVFATCMAGILLSALCGRKYSPLVVAIAGALASIFIVLASATVLLTGQTFNASLWVLDGFGRFMLCLDPLSSVFLAIAGVVYFSISLFVRNFLKDQRAVDYPAHRYGVMYFALMAFIVLILVASDAPLFLISWECMSILCFLLINYELQRQSDKMAGYIMLAMSEAGFLAMVVAFLIVGRNATDLSFSALAVSAATLSPGALWGAFLLGFFGFGVKAGLVPVNFWLPRSYTAAPAVFIPVFAGVTLWNWRIGSYRRKYHRHRRNPLCDDGQRYENDARSQFHRERRHHRGWAGRFLHFSRFRRMGCSSPCACRGALSHGESFGL
jgi:formate hydrogenlyase subunit 3/multisubunit Na+/H+ antiporter MnhD subunit